MEQGVARGVGRPRRFQRRQFSEAGARPGVDTVILGFPGEVPPASEVISEVLGDTGHLDRDRGEVLGELAECGQDQVELRILPGDGRLVTSEVVDDEREPWPVLSRPNKPGDRQVPCDDQRVQVR